MDTAQLLLLSWCVGDGFGSQTDAMESQAIDWVLDGPISEVYTLEEIQPLSGQSGAVGDIALLCGLSIIDIGAVDIDHLASKYRTYHAESSSFPFPQKGDDGRSLIRTPILALLDGRYPYTKWEALVRSETRITHTSPLALDAALLLSRAFVLLVNQESDSAHHLCTQLIAEVGKRRLDGKLEVMLRTAINQKPLSEPIPTKSYQILDVLTAVFHTLLGPYTYEEGLSLIARRGGSSRLGCAIYSSLKALVEQQPPPERFIDEVYPSPTLEAMIKKETLFRRETIMIERLAEKIARSLTIAED